MLNKIIDDDICSILQNDLSWGQLANKKVLVLGINSFIAYYMIHTLNKINSKKSKIIGVYRDKNRFKNLYEDTLDVFENVYSFDEFIPFCQETLKDVDIVIHAASPASQNTYLNNPIDVINSNIILTKSVLDSVKNVNLQSFLYFSSSQIYGDVSLKSDPLKEEYFGSLDPLEERSSYSESKRAGEMICAAYYREYKIPVKIVRPFHTYGPCMRLADGRIFSDFVANILDKTPLLMKSYGQDVRSFCYIKDAVLGYFTVMLRGLNSVAYNIGNPDQAFSMQELANTLYELFPNSPPKFLVEDQSSQLKTIYIPDISRIKALGWVPEISVKDGFLRTVKSYEHN